MTQLPQTKRGRRIIDVLEAEATAHGHALAEWTKGRWGFHSRCTKCGAFVAFTASTGKVREGERLYQPCESST